MVPGWRARLVSVMLACALPLGNGATAAPQQVKMQVLAQYTRAAAQIKYT